MADLHSLTLTLSPSLSLCAFPTLQEATKNDPSKFPFTYKVNPYDHLDFVLATNAFSYIYDPILKILAGAAPNSVSK